MDYPMDTHKRSFMKTISWRVVATVVTGLITLCPPGREVGNGKARSRRSAASPNLLTGPPGRNRQSRPAGARKETGEHGPPRRPGEPEHLHHSRCVPQVPGPRDAVVDRGGL